MTPVSLPMTAARRPWNKGLRQPLTRCLRHRVTRRRLPCGAVLCDPCHREASSAWNRRNQSSVRAARQRFARKESS